MSEQEAFENWFYRTCPSGDVDAVNRQWLTSTDFAGWFEEQL